jgi:selenocysteine lyase/cysteine desulfurase
LVFVSNTTTGTNAVLRSLQFNKGDALLVQPFTYFAVRNTCQYVAERQGLELVTVEFPIPLTSVKQLVDVYEQTLISHPNIRLAVLDYISSVPPILMPVKELIAICRRHGVMVFVDGAHTPGQVELDLDNLGADFYAGNLHKWAFAPRGCAVLWVHPDYHHRVFPVVTSFYDVTNMENNFRYQGTNDNSQYFTASAALQFYDRIGGCEKIANYSRDVVTKAADLLVAKWNTYHYPLPDEMRAPFMRMIRIPDLKNYPIPETKPGATDIVDLMMVLWDRFGIQTVCVVIENEPWVRISSTVYNAIEDYERLADAILILKAEENMVGQKCPQMKSSL